VYTNRKLFELIVIQKDQPHATNSLTEDELITTSGIPDVSEGFFDSLIVIKNVNIFLKATVLENINVLKT
jgi:hypothetical protein